MLWSQTDCEVAGAEGRMCMLQESPKYGVMSAPGFNYQLRSECGGRYTSGGGNWS
jgi:hypothetical protein